MYIYYILISTNYSLILIGWYVDIVHTVLTNIVATNLLIRPQLNLNFVRKFMCAVGVDDRW